jgi:O-antigen/teichoic acid export membrane protein
MLITAQLLGQAINTVVSIVTSRVLGPTRRGVIDTVTSYGIIPGIIGEAGLTRAAIQQIARSEPEALPVLVGHMAATRFATNAIYLLITWASLLLPFNDKLAVQEKWFIVIWSFSLVFQSFRRNAEAAFQATERLRFHSALVIANRVTAAALILAIMYYNRDLIDVPRGAPGWYTIVGYIIGAYLLVDALDALISWIVLKRNITRPKFDWDLRPKLQMLRQGWPFALQMLAGQIYYYIDVPLIRYLYPDAIDVENQVAYYSRAYVIVLVLIQLPINLTYTMFAQMSRAYHVGDQDRLYSLFRRTFQLLLLTGTPFALAFYLFRSDFVLMIYGSAYAPSIRMMGILLWTLPLAFLNAAISNLLASSDRQHWVNLAMGVAAVFNVIVNVALIPRHGALGSSIATLATEAVMLIVQSIVVLMYHRGAFPMRTLIPMLGFQLVMSLGLGLGDHINGWLRAGIYLVYVAICVAWAVRIFRPTAPPQTA